MSLATVKRTERRISTEIIISLVILAAILAVFSRALEAGFVEWDDDIVYDNPHIRGLDWERIRWMFTDMQYLWRYMPLTWLSWAATYELFGLNPFGYHLGNLVLHGANAVLVFFLLRKLFLAGPEKESIGERRNDLLWCCGMGALLWAIHPLRVEPVVWVTDRVYCQALLFLLVSLLCYLEWCNPAHARRRRYYWYSVGGFVASLLSYPTGLGYILVLPVLDAYPLRRFNRARDWWRDAAARRIWLEKVPFAGAGAAAVLLTFLARFNPASSYEHAATLADFGIVERAMQAFYIWAYFLWKPWFPVHLSPAYAALITVEPTAPRFVLSLLLVIGLTVILAIQRRRWGLAWTLWLCHLFLLVPVLGLTEHPHYPNDRYAYFVGIAWSILAAAGLFRLGSLALLRRAMPGVAGVILLVLGTLSYRQSGIWQNSVALHEYMIAELGDSPHRIVLYLRLGKVHWKQGQDENAAECFRQVLRMNPEVPEAHWYLARVLQKQGKLEEAIRHYREVLKLDPKDSSCHNNLGAALAAQGKLEEGVGHLSEAVRLDPDSASAHHNLARALAQLGRSEESAAHERQAEQLETRQQANPR